MSKTAWIFGDSFQASNYPDGTTESWCDILFQFKGYDVLNYAVAGSSTESIVIRCIDCLDKISKDDFVLVCLSAGPRFMAPQGSGNTSDKDFNKYIDLDPGKHHPSIWHDFEETKNTAILDFADRYNTRLGDRLKHSVYNNYISLMLRQIGCKFKIVHGHFEPLKVKSDYVSNYVYDADHRTMGPNVSNYYDLQNAMEFPSGFCLIHDFFDVQVEHLVKTFDKEAVEEFYNNSYKKLTGYMDSNSKLKKPKNYANSVMKYFINPIKKRFGKENSIFLDAWHLDTNGHKIYASYVKDYNWET